MTRFIFRFEGGARIESGAPAFGAPSDACAAAGSCNAGFVPPFRVPGGAKRKNVNHSSERAQLVGDMLVHFPCISYYA